MAPIPPSVLKTATVLVARELYTERLTEGERAAFICLIILLSLTAIWAFYHVLSCTASRIYRFMDRIFREIVRFLKLIRGCCFLFYAYLLSIAQKAKAKMNGTATAGGVPSPGSSVTTLLPSESPFKAPARVKVPAPTYSRGRFATRTNFYPKSL
ncbi:hypothetical protein N7474_009570 [Penicillium riverlandense]|uniref:uncharacterized protein n=1 Tax=Penicillium riverlandense TaxID=1903569 RepID=UPI002547EA13|nr:uncharacterized protein N7474_009570 [Penicillium riverlandense]KAJ5808301.1 hypothetical protein N7474_009570 [Penicillium riverlandense]